MMKAGNNRSVDIPTLIKNRDDLIAQLESRIDTLQKQDPSILNV